MLAKYLIISFIVVFILLLVLVITKPKWFGITSKTASTAASTAANVTERAKKYLEFKRTSINGEMTLNPLSSDDTKTIYFNASANAANASKKRKKNKNKNVPHDMPHNMPHNMLHDMPHDMPHEIPYNMPHDMPHDMPHEIPYNMPHDMPHDMPHEIPHDMPHEIPRPELHGQNIRPPDQARVDILIPPNYRHMNGFVDIMFNDIMTIFQTIQHGNEFNVIQHLNDNNFNPIILNDNTILMEIIDNQLLEMMGIHRNNIIQNRQNDARNRNLTINGAVNNYLDLAMQQTNDAQNVHDHTVLAGFKLILKRLKEEYIPELETVEQIENEIKKRARGYSDNRPQLTLDVLAVIEKIKEGEKITALEIDGEPTTDAMCLQYVWNRTSHPNNASKKNQMRQAIFDNLLDSWELNALTGIREIVCVTGRATRIISSLTLLDFDEQNWEVKKFEDFKNEIFVRVKNIIQEEAIKATHDPNEDIQNAGKMYTATTLEELNLITKPTQEATAELNTRIKESISNMIDNYVINIEKEFNTNIPNYMKNSVKKEAIASIDMF